MLTTSLVGPNVRSARSAPPVQPPLVTAIASPPRRIACSCRPRPCSEPVGVNRKPLASNVARYAVVGGDALPPGAALARHDAVADAVGHSVCIDLRLGPLAGRPPVGVHGNSAHPHVPLRGGRRRARRPRRRRPAGAGGALLVPVSQGDDGCGHAGPPWLGSPVTDSTNGTRGRRWCDPALHRGGVHTGPVMAAPVRAPHERTGPLSVARPPYPRACGTTDRGSGQAARLLDGVGAWRDPARPGHEQPQDGRAPRRARAPRRPGAGDEPR